jgi:hypothetical protein
MRVMIPLYCCVINLWLEVLDDNALYGAWLILNCQKLVGKSVDQLLKQVVEGSLGVNAQATMDG